MQGEERREIEVKIGYILKKDKKKYPKEKVLGEESHEMERKVGYKMRKSRENIQNAA